jgi:hypothetical protein
VRRGRIENDKPYILLCYFLDVAQRGTLLIEAFHLENEQFLTDGSHVCSGDLSEALAWERVGSDKYDTLFASDDVYRKQYAYGSFSASRLSEDVRNSSGRKSATK